MGQSLPGGVAGAGRGVAALAGVEVRGPGGRSLAGREEGGR
ncbi:hypothetical protein E2C01_097878 [Portunus trituberculatus]|uniref:Uncharacterized protein n=1 Tax=Portunus trituberculatus TaxID=210409 RepID=A0A5B7JWB5_PORTR|nr:hypothetical protein [Portunus trituberculatus]